MPSPHRRSQIHPVVAFAMACALGACRPTDAPKEPTEPADPTVHLEPTPDAGGYLAAPGNHRTRLALR